MLIAQAGRMDAVNVTRDPASAPSGPNLLPA